MAFTFNRLLGIYSGFKDDNEQSILYKVNTRDSLSPYDLWCSIYLVQWHYPDLQLGYDIFD